MKIILTHKFTTSKNVISKVLNLFTEHVVIYVYTYTGNLFSLPQRIEFVSNIEMFINCQVEHWRRRWRDYEELYSFSILQNFIRSSLSSNWFQSVNFAGNPHFAAEEVRQGVDGGRRTVGSWESAKVQVTSPVVLVDTRLHESMRAYVSPRPWTRTRKDGWRSCDEEESHRVDKVGGKRGIGEKKKSGKVKSGVKKREGERENERRRRRGPVKSYPKSRAAEGAWQRAAAAAVSFSAFVRTRGPQHRPYRLARREGYLFVSLVSCPLLIRVRLSTVRHHPSSDTVARANTH